MNRKMVFYMIGKIVLAEAAMLLLPLVVALLYKETPLPFLITIGIALVLGIALSLIFKPKDRVIYAKEGFVIVAFAWIALSLIGCIPFVLSGALPNFFDAFFETVSGFTTTYGGWASVFTAVALCCFAFSTIIGWGLYGSRFLVFLCKSNKVARPFFVVYALVAILGATMDLGLLWSIADTFNGLMSIPNLIALLLLSGTVVQLTRAFFKSEG